jgi:hypothetical protein
LIDIVLRKQTFCIGEYDDEIPDHSVLSKARKRWGKEVFVTLFRRVVQQPSTQAEMM